jgi:hypothetical protein
MRKIKLYVPVFFKLKLLPVFFSFVLGFFITSTYGQTQYNVVPTGGTVGNTNGTGGDPICRYYNSIRYQVVYTVAELTASGMTAGTTLTRLAWNVTESSVSLGNYSIKMGHTSSSNSTSHNVDATTTVKSPFTYTVSTGWNDINFDNTFTWNGTSNIIVEICTGPSNPYTSPYGGVQAKTGLTAGSARFIRNDGSSQCSNNTTTTTTNKPYIRFTADPLCTTPLSQPTSLTLSALAGQINGSFTAPTSIPSGYLIVRTSNLFSW